MNNDNKGAEHRRRITSATRPAVKSQPRQARTAEPDDLFLEALDAPLAKPAKPLPEQHKKPRRRKPVKQAWWATPVALCMLSVLLLLCSFMVAEIRGYAGFLQKKQHVDRATFYPGVSVESVDLSQMTLEQAQAEWAARDQRARDALTLKLVLGERTWDVDAESLGYHSNYEQAITSAWSVGRYGTLEERYQVVNSLTSDDWRRDFPVERGLDENHALQGLTPLANALSVPVVNAAVLDFNEKDRSFTFTDSRPGAEVDPNELLDSIKKAAASGARTVRINRREVPPLDTARTLADTYGQISSASTDAGFSTSNRLANLKLSTAGLNGLRIEPGETFSFNKTLGKRTAKKGYKPAGAYENGITTNQLGGGICQVSTTLFNAVAKADMKIVERAPHSRPSSYVGLGKDAAVNWPNQDFRFTNTSDYPIYITASLSKSKKVQMAVYGKKLPGGVTIQITSEKTAEYPAKADQVTKDPNLLPGERVVVEAARNGYRAVTYRVYLDAKGKQLKKVELCKSYYAPSGAIVRVGTE